jgi:glyoxylase I family protein
MLETGGDMGLIAHDMTEPAKARALVRSIVRHMLHAVIIARMQLVCHPKHETRRQNWFRYPTESDTTEMELGLDGSTHFTLIVTDLARSRDWYERVFGFREIRSVDVPDIVIAGDRDGCGADHEFRILYHLHAHIFLGLSRPKNARPEPFSNSTCGLQHFALHVRARSDLDLWMTRLDGLNIAHSGIKQEGPGRLVRFRDPDGIPVEVYWTDADLARDMFVQVARERVQTSASRRRASSA